MVIKMTEPNNAVSQIRQAEDEAVKRRQAAIEKARDISAEAEKKAASLKSAAEDEAEAAKKKLLAEAEASAAEFKKQAAVKAKVKANKLKADCADRLEAAASLIASKLA